MAKESILIVDDSEMNRSILTDMLIDEFDVTEAEDGEAALTILKEKGRKFSLVLLDIVMPKKDGFDVLAEMNRVHLIEEVPVIMVSAERASAQIERAYELGATDFIMRPFDASIVHRRVLNTILLYAKQKKLLGIIEDQIYEKEENSRLMVDILSHIVEFRNGESGLHIQHVRVITEYLLRQLVKKTDRYPLTEEEISVIAMASALHDIGKIGIDDKILNKPGKLTAEEFAVMKTHSMIGAKMLENLSVHAEHPIVRTAYEICRWHHERYDGRGYPDGLKGDDIPISAQIVALADVYDALTSERVYKPPIPYEEAMRMILSGQCGAFNPLLLECLSDEFVRIRDMLVRDTNEKAARHEIHNFAEAVLHSKGRSASERTLKLLDYERMKFNFYAELTEEIQFEYIVEGDILRLSPWGAKKFGVETEVFHPAENETLCAVLGKDWFASFSEFFRKTTPGAPDFHIECEVPIGGERRWYKLIVRSFWSDDIPPRLVNAIGKLVDVHDMHTMVNELKELSIRDPLTGLMNRTGVQEGIERKIGTFPAHKYAFAVLDIDFFKSANDEYGHLFGDRVLSEMAERLIHSTRAGDLCARIGGDEFLIVFEYNTDIQPIIARVFKALCGKVDDFELTVSMGVVEMTDASESYRDLFRKADIALYVSKRSGRAQYTFFDPAMASDPSLTSMVADRFEGEEGEEHHDKK